MKTVSVSFLCICLLAASISAQIKARPLQRASSWDDFVYPTVTVVDKDNGSTEGSQLVQRIIPDLESFVKDIAKGVCQKLYKEVNEVPQFDELIFEMEYREGLAYKAGETPRITINMSTQYLENIHSSNGDDAILYEIAGVLWHELTHAYQLVPQNAGEYMAGTEFFGFIEGTADAVRILAGYHDTRSPNPGGSWRDGYTKSGFFIQWVQDNYDEDFLYQLNQSCLTFDPWSYEQACQAILGKSVQSLWDEYQWYLEGGGDEAVAIFSADKRLICKGEPVTFTNRSLNTPTSYLWDFPGATVESSSDTNPVITYETAGVFDVSLTVQNEFGTTTETKKEFITVVDVKGTMFEITKPDGAISTNVEQPFYGENVEKLLDHNADTKLCVKTGTLHIEYAGDSSSQLYAYSFTSGRDASWRDPQSWILSGSEDGIVWEELDQQVDVVFTSRQETQLYTVNCSDHFQFYRFDILAQTDTMFQLADMVLYGVETAKETAAEQVKPPKTTLQMSIQGSTLLLSNTLTYRELTVYNARGMKIASYSGDLLNVNALSLGHLAKGYYLITVKAVDGLEQRSYNSSFILK